jgi:hypothetical protein
MYVLTTTCAKCPTVESWIGNGPTGGHQMRHRLAARVVSMKPRVIAIDSVKHRVTLSRAAPGCWRTEGERRRDRARGLRDRRHRHCRSGGFGPGRIVASGQHLELGICQEGRSRRCGWHVEAAPLTARGGQAMRVRVSAAQPGQPSPRTQLPELSDGCNKDRRD